MTTQDPRRVFGRYEILSLLGRGGMAEVFRARVLSGSREGQDVALKRLLPALAKDPQYIDQFTSEADLSRCLDHPNVVRVQEVGVIDEIYFMEMEWVDGRDLGQVLRRCSSRGIPLPLDFALYLGRTLLDALAYAHTATSPKGKPLEIVHCDVSPSNLFISRTGEIKLGDFGVARGRMLEGRAGGFHGKPYYVSPEVIAGEVTTEADLWAASVTLYELLTLERPFTGATPDEVFDAIRSRRLKPPSALRPEVPAAVDALFTRAFARDRKARFTTAQDYVAALDPLFDERIGNPMAIAAVVRGLFDNPSGAPPRVPQAGRPG